MSVRKGGPVLQRPTGRVSSERVSVLNVFGEIKLRVLGRDIQERTDVLRG